MLMAKNPEARIRLEVLNAVMSPEFQNHDRRQIANRLKAQFMKDPELLATFERLLGSQTRGLARLAPTAEELKSFGWSEEDVVACPAAVVAAAAATWAAAAAQTVRQ
jgi:hypothetical protein